MWSSSDLTATVDKETGRLLADWDDVEDLDEDGEEMDNDKDAGLIF